MGTFLLFRGKFCTDLTENIYRYLIERCSLYRICLVYYEKPSCLHSYLPYREVYLLWRYLIERFDCTFRYKCGQCRVMIADLEDVLICRWCDGVVSCKNAGGVCIVGRSTFNTMAALYRRGQNMQWWQCGRLSRRRLYIILIVYYIKCFILLAICNMFY